MMPDLNAILQQMRQQGGWGQPSPSPWGSGGPASMGPRPGMAYTGGSPTFNENPQLGSVGTADWQQQLQNARPMPLPQPMPYQTQMPSMPTRPGFAQPPQNLPWGGAPGPAPGMMLPRAGTGYQQPAGNTLQSIMQRGGPQRTFAPPQRGYSNY